MARVRVVCKAPPPMAAHDPYPAINILPSICDVDVFVVRADGTEEPLQGVTAIRWDALSNGEPNRLALELCDGDVDIEGEAELVRRSEAPGPYSGT